MSLMRRRVMSGKAPRLPREYQEVEYLHGTGSQYIDLLTHYDQLTKVEVKYNAIEQGYIIGGSPSAISWYIYSDSARPFTRKVEFQFPTPTTGVHTLVLTDNLCIYDGNSITASSKNIPIETNNARIFANGIYIASNLQIMKLEIEGSRNYSLVPCYLKSDTTKHTAGLYDLVSQTFFPNAGTGYFLVGADV